jgi:hypothetical protein
MEKTVFRATTIVAGTNNARSAAKTDETTGPIPIPSKEPVTLSIPNLLIMTNIAPAQRKVWASLLGTLKNPIRSPRRTRMPYIWGLYCDNEGRGRSVVDSPMTTAKITPIKKAHAPTEFSLAFITIFYYCSPKSLSYINFCHLGNNGKISGNNGKIIIYRKI